jgi:hypothetical protein
VAHNARELLEHKMHLTELESKMKLSSLDDDNILVPYQLKASNSSLSSQITPDEPLRNDSISSFKTHHQHSNHESNHKPNQARYLQTNINDRGDGDIISIQRELYENTLRRESFLDEYCETLVFDKIHNSHCSDNKYKNNGDVNPIAKSKKLEFTDFSVKTTEEQNKINSYIKSNGHSTIIANGTKPSLDEKKKTKLLHLLKHIDNNNSSSIEN